MSLRLSVVSEHGIQMGQNSTKVFGVHGGTVGRGTDNEWILPDPERYLSGKHLRIDFRAGRYVLVDTSSNGTYVNGSHVPLGKYRDHSLAEGDSVRIGEFELMVSIDSSNDFAPDPDAVVAFDGRAPSAAVKKATAGDLGADLDVSELLEAGVPARTRDDRPRDAYGRPTDAHAPRSNDDSSEPSAEAEARATPWHMMTRPLKAGNGGAGTGGAANGGAANGGAGTGAAANGVRAASAGPVNGTAANGGARSSGSGPEVSSAPAAARATAAAPASSESGADAGLTAFCRGAGIDPTHIAGEARSAALQLAGQLLRESVLGLMDLNQSRSEFRNRFRIPAPDEDGPDSPLNFSRGVDEALVRLLSTSSTRAGSVEAIRTNFRELKAQTAASLAAMHAAFEEFLGRVDPKDLAERFERATKRGVFGAQSKSKYWDLYGEMYAGLAQRPADGFPHLFNETFAKAYEAKLRKLVPPPRGPAAAGREEPQDPDARAAGP